MDAARGRAGFFTPADAIAFAISPQLLRYRVATGWIRHELRGVYRFVSVPPTEHDELIALWLWSAEQGAFSHLTALALHDLSDALPAKVHMTVPTAWRDGRFARPSHLVLHFADLPPAEIQWYGHVPVTTVTRTITDCMSANVSATLVEQALAQARARGQLTSDEHARLLVAHTKLAP